MAMTFIFITIRNFIYLKPTATHILIFLESSREVGNLVLTLNQRFWSLKQFLKTFLEFVFCKKGGILRYMKIMVFIK